MSPVTNIVLAGVGGQGSVMAGRIIARTATLKKMQVATSEVHGMAQRGGSVLSTVRFGDEVYSPVIPKGKADYLLGFEKLEALRYLGHLKKGGVALVNDQQITPTIEALKEAPYPLNVEALLQTRAGHSLLVAGLKIATEIGNPKLANTVLVGALASFLPFAEETWHHALKELVPPDTMEQNMRAFRLGLEMPNTQRREQIIPDPG
jgi:indolepyruvate ferredoxin oxidoreductase beta subunit